jgi:CelD/BcsL family acetyltransferase involved in cellulose biosynthesis/GNAT superfamily N-acetyltransferase
MLEKGIGFAQTIFTPSLFPTGSPTFDEGPILGISRMTVTRIDLICGQPAHDLLGSSQFLLQWERLHDNCHYATVFQSADFARAWYTSYADQWQPVLALSRCANGDVQGLWLLAQNRASSALVHAGDRQAEYQTWLALPGEEMAFVKAAWAELKRTLAFSTLRCIYLPSPKLENVLREALGNEAEVLRHPRPLLALDAKEISASFAKKGNKSRFNRLRKLGTLEFRRITSKAELERVLDTLIEFYDFRQSAINQTAPFQEDCRKRAFHIAMFEMGGDALYFTATYLDDIPIAAFWGMSTKKMVHLGMLISSPFCAEHSPGKLHIMQLSEYLLGDGQEILDLTPGGDAWKERFASTHDEVLTAVLYSRPAARRKAQATAYLLNVVKKGLHSIKITPDHFRALLQKLRQVRPAAFGRKLKNFTGIDREFRVYRIQRQLASPFAMDPRVHCNAISELLQFEPGESWQTRNGFLGSALKRIEEGSVAYSIQLDKQLAHCGWLVAQSQSYMSEVEQLMTFPPDSIALYDFYTDPKFRGQGLYRATVAHMLCAAFARPQTQFVYISVLADNLPSRHVIETMGFEYQASFFMTRRFGKLRKWNSLTVATEAGNA